jgi:hypothetical protein
LNNRYCKDVVGGVFVKKKIVISTILMIIIVIVLLAFITGGKMAGVFLNDYAISEDGHVMTLKVGVASSLGYVRTFKVRQDDNKLYLTFYSTFGLNSKIGATNEFQIKLASSASEIYFYRGNIGYELILKKNEDSNEWQKIKSNVNQ